MARVINTSENASENISGFRFEPHPQGMISEELDDATAARFLTMPKYIPVPSEAPPAPAKPPATPVDLTADTYGALRVPQIAEILTADPGRADEIEAFELAREKPRNGVMDAVAAARRKTEEAEQTGDNPGASGDPGTGGGDAGGDGGAGE